MRCDLASIDEERQRREAFIRRPDGSVGAQFTAALNDLPDPRLRRKIGEVRFFAENCAYRHPGLSQEAYVAHPLRVATMYLRAADVTTAFGPSLALVHNIYETTDVNRTDAAAALGTALADAISLLTVDRSRQWDRAYKARYYADIASAEFSVRVVKVLDKLDNLFLLAQNRDAVVRRLYLNEVEEHVLPIAHQDLPQCAEYIERLVAYGRTHRDCIV